MSVLGTFGRALPRPLRNVAIHGLGEWRRWREHRRFGNVANASCDARRLGTVDQAWLSKALSAPAIDAEWPTVEQELGTFRITTAAGGVNPGDRRALYYIIRALRPNRLLEIGTHIGASTVHAAAALRADAEA